MSGSSSDLYVERRGEGRRVVFAHGFAGSARNWRGQARALEDRFEVVTYDARGHARSPKASPEDFESEGLARLASDLEGLLAEPPTPLPAVVVGLSMGASTALEVALRGRVPLAGLVLASPPAGPRSSGAFSGSALAFAQALEEEGLEEAGARFVWGPESGLDEAGARLVRQGFLEHDPVSLARILRGVLARLPGVESRREALAALALPIWIVVGERDAGSRAAGEALAAHLPQAELEVVPGAGHVVNLAAPKAFNAGLIRFLERVGPREGPAGG